MADTVWQGRFISVVKDGTWEYVARRDDIDAAVIVAIDDAGAVLLIEQHRVPLGRACLELPAGLVGDEGPEDVATAAARELEEETGHRAAHVAPLGEFHSSPGMTSERFTIVRATGLTKVAAPEDGITLHKVPLAGLAAFIAARRAAGIAVDAKLLLILSLETLAAAGPA